MLSRYALVVLATIVIVLSVYSNYLLNKVDALNSKLAIVESNELVLKKSIATQNEKVVKYEIDLQTKTEEYDKLVGQPPEIRYETVYKKVPNIKVKSNECKDIKKLLDDIRTAGY